MTTYIPFGDNCLPAFVLRDAGLRKESLPFDWVLGEPEHLKRSLDLNFSDWFEGFEIVELTKYGEEKINDETNNKRITYHPNYPIDKNITYTGCFFAHMDFSDQTVVASMKKRIARFNEIIQSDQVILVTSMPKKSFDDYGLLDYFNKDTHVIFIDFIHKSKQNISVDQFDGYTLITYSAAKEFDDSIMVKLGNTVKSLYPPKFFKTNC